MDLQLEGQRAVIAGGARGIGLAIARAFATEGAEVVLIDRDPAVESAARELGPERARGIVGDLVDYPAVQAIAAGLGRCDHVVCAAAIGSGKFGMPFWELEPRDWERVLRVNIMGSVNVAHAFAPTFAERGSGTLLFIGSVAGQIGSPTDPPYSASKAALINFAQCAARDLAPFGVRVNTINPGMVRTALNHGVWEAWSKRQPEGQRQSYDEWTAEKIRRMVPLNRWQEPEEIAALAVLLASDRARNITGQTLNVDGGFVMHC